MKRKGEGERTANPALDAYLERLEVHNVDFVGVKLDKPGGRRRKNACLVACSLWLWRVVVAARDARRGRLPFEGGIRLVLDDYIATIRGAALCCMR